MLSLAQLAQQRDLLREAMLPCTFRAVAPSTRQARNAAASDRPAAYGTTEYVFCQHMLTGRVDPVPYADIAPATPLAVVIPQP
ncbi:hypothetical protein OO015_07180 [Thermomicrobium sp. 4228-Ro]|uniref:hypothetical protein n=1 Tax=Thermomicrobium sp. 4228-Ro TaxID=2993937 RepID=UPI0022487674|nr:hypothetical protein [Thermomicrobium sp. 4228-Ro]MCX2727280.1 hypothetical protein [Thermomicrobium sp. 4228-Ro]